MCFIKPVLFKKQPGQGVNDPKLLIMPVERRCNSKGCPIVVNSLLCLTLGVTYITKELITLTECELFPFFWEEID